jgi:hypothetical protein
MNIIGPCLSACFCMHICVRVFCIYFRTDKNRNAMDLFLFNFILNFSFFVSFWLLLLVPSIKIIIYFQIIC